MVHIVPGQAIGTDRIESLNLGFHCGGRVDQRKWNRWSSGRTLEYMELVA